MFVSPTAVQASTRPVPFNSTGFTSAPHKGQVGLGAVVRPQAVQRTAEIVGVLTAQS